MSDVVRLDNIKTRPQNEEYRKGWERTFAPKHEYRCGVCFGLGSIPLANRLDRCDSCEGTGKVLR